MAKQTIYTVGGTVQAGGGIYIKRRADDELLELCQQGELAFILSSRQVGKSSLMVRTAQELEKESIYSVTIDLSAIGVKVSPDEWYLGILNEIGTSLQLETNVFNWWSQYAQLGPAQRLTNFFRDVLLKEVKERIVLFFDEIDSTLSIPFSDDFYVAIRSVYNARSTTPDFKRLSFVLIGVATPSDLISDNKRTPFNIGQRVEINDFTLTEALPLASGFGTQAEQVLAWVFQFTGGHPYLTQRLCAYLANSKESLDEHAVANAVERLFTGEQGKQDNNLQFVRDMLSGRSPDVTRVMLIYRDIRSGKKVLDDERSITKAHLKLSGLVHSEQGFLRVRNEVYKRVFNLQWIRDNTPKNWQKVAVISLGATLGILILVTLTVFTHDYLIGTRIDRHVTHFYFAKSAQERITDLAEIYRQKGILQDKDSDFTASQLFYGLPYAKDQLDLFKIDPHYKPPDPAWQNDLVIVISHLYITVANVDPEEDTTALLQTMLNALNTLLGNPDAMKIKAEIAAWLDGRKSLDSGDYETALAKYNDALSLNPGNQAALYERAKVYVALGEFNNALKDLDTTISAAKQSAPKIATSTPTLSSIPASAMPNATEAQSTEPSVLPTEITSVPSGVLETPAISPTSEPSLTPTPAPTAPTNIPSKKYESNFTTLIDVVNAVQAVIDNTRQLQITMQSNGQTEYTNLQSFGLIKNYPTQAPPVVAPVSGGADKMAFVANNEIWIINVNGSGLKQLTADGGTKSDLQWLPDGENIIFISGLTVKFYNVKTEVVDTLTSFPSAISLNAFRVSHDGKQVIVALNNEIFVVPFDLNKMKEIHKKSDLLALEPCIVPKGKTKSALVVKEARWATDDQLVAWLYKGPDATDLVSVLDIHDCNPDTITIRDTFPGTRFNPVGFQNGMMPDFDWDGSNLFVFNTNRRNNGWGELYAYNWQTHKPLFLNPIENKCCYRDARWSPDGSYLFFAFQDASLGAAAPTLLYYVPFGEIGTGTNFTPISLPEGLFNNPKEAPQPALHPAP